MALIECNYYSDVLGMNRTMMVILPQRTMNQIGVHSVGGTAETPVLYLLHGLSDNHTAWTRNTSIERYASQAGLAVVMPCVNRSFYTDMAQGYRYFTHVSEELPRICNTFFQVSKKPERTFVAGLSMGGYGAFKLALRRPERYAAAASLSGALDLRLNDNASWEGVPGEGDLVFGPWDEFVGSNNDLIHLASDLIGAGKTCPKLYAWCGTEDFLHDMNLSFRDHAKEVGIELNYEEGPGDHQWLYWDRQIQRVIEWLPL